MDIARWIFVNAVWLLLFSFESLGFFSFLNYKLSVVHTPLHFPQTWKEWHGCSFKKILRSKLTYMKLCGTSAHLLLYAVYFYLELTASVPLCNIDYASNVVL